MKKIILILAVTSFFNSAAEAGVKELINKNIQDATQVYNRSMLPEQRPSEPMRLWIHIRNGRQVDIANQILDMVEDSDSAEWLIERKPVQVVKFGPQTSQLRFFKDKDKPEAEKLFEFLRKLVPQLALINLSDRYAHVSWIKPGHFELWLSPNTEALESPN